MLPCDPLSVSRYLDGEMLLPERLEFERHLGTCDACRTEIEALRSLERKVERWSRGQVAVPRHVESRLRQSVDKRQRFAPVLALSRMMPAAVGSCVAALLVAVTANFGSFQVARPSASATAHQQSALVNQSVKLSNARRATAILGGRLSTVHRDVSTRHPVQLDVE